MTGWRRRATISVLLAVSTGAIAAVGCAVILAVLNIYCAGHNIDWPAKQVGWAPGGMSVLNVMWIAGTLTVPVCTVAVYLLVSILSARGRNR